MLASDRWEFSTWRTADDNRRQIASSLPRLISNCVQRCRSSDIACAANKA